MTELDVNTVVIDADGQHIRIQGIEYVIVPGEEMTVTLRSTAPSLAGFGEDVRMLKIARQALILSPPPDLEYARLTVKAWSEPVRKLFRQALEELESGRPPRYYGEIDSG